MKPEELAALSKNTHSNSVEKLLKDKPNEVFTVTELGKLIRASQSSLRAVVVQLPEENKLQCNFRGRISNIIGTPSAIRKFSKLMQ